MVISAADTEDCATLGGLRVWHLVGVRVELWLVYILVYPTHLKMFERLPMFEDLPQGVKIPN